MIPQMNMFNIVTFIMSHTIELSRPQQPFPHSQSFQKQLEDALPSSSPTSALQCWEAKRIIVMTEL